MEGRAANKLPQAFLARMESQLGAAYPRFLDAMAHPPRRALRVNALKTDGATLCRLADFALTPTGVSDDSFFFDAHVAIGKSPLHAAGLFYVQELSAQIPVSLLGVREHMRVLDLCAAPGGKAAQIAALLNNTGLLLANDPVRARADTLADNLARMGARNALVTCMRPDALAETLGAAFDAVLVDAPCSGEGMFRKDEAAIAEWSSAHVDACAARQKRILDSAARLVRPGGRLVYATCTFSREENEDNVSAFLASQSDFSLLETRRILPQDGLGEGQFMAAFTRAGESEPPVFPASRTARVPAWEAFFADTFAFSPAPRTLLLPDGRVLLPPICVPPRMDRLRIVRAGTLAGEVMRKRFVPDHALALAYPERAFHRSVALTGEELTRFLAGEPVPCAPALAGWCAITTGGYPLGWGKAVSGTLKNHIPKGLRIGKTSYA